MYPNPFSWSPSITVWGGDFFEQSNCQNQQNNFGRSVFEQSTISTKSVYVDSPSIKCRLPNFQSIPPVMESHDVEIETFLFVSKNHFAAERFDDRKEPASFEGKNEGEVATQSESHQNVLNGRTSSFVTFGENHFCLW